MRSPTTLVLVHLELRLSLVDQLIAHHILGNKVWNQLSHQQLPLLADELCHAVIVIIKQLGGLALELYEVAEGFLQVLGELGLVGFLSSGGFLRLRLALNILDGQRPLSWPALAAEGLQVSNDVTNPLDDAQCGELFLSPLALEIHGTASGQELQDGIRHDFVQLCGLTLREALAGLPRQHEDLRFDLLLYVRKLRASYQDVFA